MGSVVEALMKYTEGLTTGGGGGVTTEAGSATVTVMVPPPAGVVNKVTLSVGTV